MANLNKIVASLTVAAAASHHLNEMPLSSVLIETHALKLNMKGRGLKRFFKAGQRLFGSRESTEVQRIEIWKNKTLDDIIGDSEVRERFIDYVANGEMSRDADWGMVQSNILGDHKTVASMISVYVEMLEMKKKAPVSVGDSDMDRETLKEKAKELLKKDDVKVMLKQILGLARAPVPVTEIEIGSMIDVADFEDQKTLLGLLLEGPKDAFIMNQMFVEDNPSIYGSAPAVVEGIPVVEGESVSASTGSSNERVSASTGSTSAMIAKKLRSSFLRPAKWQDAIQLINNLTLADLAVDKDLYDSFLSFTQYQCQLPNDNEVKSFLSSYDAEAIRSGSWLSDCRLRFLVGQKNSYTVAEAILKIWKDDWSWRINQANTPGGLGAF